MKPKPALLALLLAAAVGTAAAETLAPCPLQPWERPDALPASKQGRFPIHMARGEGVQEVLLLSSRWIVLVTVNLDEVYRQIDVLSTGALTRAIEAWDASEKAGKPNWTAYKARNRIHDEYAARARELAGERKLDDPAFYTIRSDDPAYATSRPPVRVTRTIVGLGGSTFDFERAALCGAASVYYAHYSYIDLPAPLQQGRVYTVTLGDGRSAAFLYDETRTVSRAIKVNQVGYLPEVHGKYAYLGAWLPGPGAADFAFAETFKVVDVDSGRVVFTGPVRLRDRHSPCEPVHNRPTDPAGRPLLTGEDVYEMNLDGLKDEGTFFITIPGVGRSWPFRHARDAYGEAFYVACRGLFHQRCGIELGPPYTAWPRIRCHTGPTYESELVPWAPGADFKMPKEYKTFDVVGGSINTRRPDGTHWFLADSSNKVTAAEAAEARKTVRSTQATGGWHDAADWDHRMYHYVVVFDLLNAYEMAPRKFRDGQLNIPESGNGIPDILDEAEYGLRIWKASMTPEGGVAGVWETWTHPTIDNPNVQWTFSLRTRWSSLVFAAAAAQYARLVKPFSAHLSDEYAAAARKAWAFGNDPAHSLGTTTIHARYDRGKGAPYTMTWTETDAMVRPFEAAARMAFAKLTGGDEWLQPVPALTEDVLLPFVWPNTYTDFSAWLYYDAAARLGGRLPASVVDRWRGFYVKTADDLAALNETMPYRMSWPRYKDFWMAWGASTMPNYARPLLMAHALAGKAAWRNAAVQDMDYALGANPLGLSFTTGLGAAYPIDIQHGPSEHDGIMDPVPGITIYGVTGGVYPALRNEAWRAPVAAGSKTYTAFISEGAMRLPVWRRWSCHPQENVPQCEFAVHETMASMAFVTALLLPDEGWMPSDELKRRAPRAPRTLFGYYYLP